MLVNLYIYIKPKPLKLPQFSTSAFILFIFYFLNFDFFSNLMRLTLSNLYAFLKPKTLTFKLYFSLSQLCLGSFRFPLSLFFPQTSHLQAIPIRSFAQFKTLSQLLCSFFADFGIFSCNLYGFTLDLKFSIDLNSVYDFLFSHSLSLFSSDIFSKQKQCRVLQLLCVCVFGSIKLFVDLSKISMDFQCTRNLTRVL